MNKTVTPELRSPVGSVPRAGGHPLCTPARQASARRRLLGLAGCAWSALVVLGACRSDQPELEATLAAGSSAPSASAAAAATPPAVSAKLDGKPLVVRTVLASSRRESSIDLLFATDEASCLDLQVPGTQTSGLSSRVMLARSLGRDGEQSWRVAETAFDGAVHTGKLADATVSQSDVNREVQARFHLKLEGAARHPKKPRVLELNGDVRATGCGTLPAEDQMAPRPQKEFELEVAGKKFVVNGATITEQDGDHQLRLSTDPHDCDTGYLEGDCVLKLELSGKPPQVASSLVRGLLFESQLNGGKLETSEVSVSMTPSGKDHLRVRLDGTYDLVGYRVRLTGSVDALVCR